jgi:hypothetical protein
MNARLSHNTPHATSVCRDGRSLAACHFVGASDLPTVSVTMLAHGRGFGACRPCQRWADWGNSATSRNEMVSSSS